MVDKSSDVDAMCHKFIVIGSEHYNPLGVIRSLGEAGVRPIAIIRRGNYRFASLSKYISRLVFVDDYEEIRAVLSEYENEDRRPFVIPCDDVCTEILDREYESLAKSFYVSNAGAKGRIAFFGEKQNQIELAEKHGLRVAKTWVVNNGIPCDIVYPVITKPTYSYDDWKQDYYVCHDEGELKEALSKVNGPVFLQQYVLKETELALDGVAVDHGKSVLVAIASTYTYALPDYYSSEMVVANCDDERIKASLVALLSEVGYEGIFEAEFLIDKDGSPWFLEINFRNSTWSYASTCLGMNLPILFAVGMLEGSLPGGAEKKIPENYIALAELMDFLQRVMKYKMISPWQWVRCVRRADCLFFFNRMDSKPFWAMCGYQAKKVLKGLLGRRG